MKIIFIRHGEPDYQKDSLTEKGVREARLLAGRISHWPVTQFYTSPLGRAKATAAYTLDALHRQAVTLDWMQEFNYKIKDPVTGRIGIPWDFVASDWTGDPLLFDQEEWVHSVHMNDNPEIAANYQNVCMQLDRLLAGYGYIREGRIYRMPDKEEVFISSTTSPDNLAHIHPAQEKAEDTIVIFCHLGAICIALSHLLNIPFPLLTHGFFLPTTSLTVLGSEERWSNEAYFRVQVMGDTHHLLSGGEPISDAGYFASSFQG